MNFVRDIGTSDSDGEMTLQVLSEVKEVLTTIFNRGKDEIIAKRFKEMARHFDQWNAYISPHKEAALWNLKMIDHCRKRVAKAVVRRPECAEQCSIDTLTPAFLSLARLAQTAPSTYYQLGKSLDALCAQSSIPELARINAGAAPITRLVTATVPLFRLLKRDLNAIFRMEPDAFEDFVAERLEHMGLCVRRTGSTYAPDGGVDLIASPRAVSFPFLLAVQVKHHRNPLTKTGPGPIKDLQAVLASLPFHAGMIVTNTTFTPDAEWWASLSGGKVQLHDLRSIRNWIEGNYEHDRYGNIPSAVQLTPRLEVEVW